jgi:hypothetical protein
MNRRDLLKGLAAAGIVLPAHANAEQAAETGKRLLGEGEGIIKDGKATEIWFRTMIDGKQLHINLDQVLNYTVHQNAIPGAYQLDEMSVEMYFYSTDHAEFLQAIHGENDVICWSERLGQKYFCTSRNSSISVDGADCDVLLSLDLIVNKTERL